MSYKTLISHLKSLLDTIDRYDTDVDANKATLKAVWSIGQEVYRYTQETGAPIKDIALDVGAPKGSLEKYVRFYKLYARGYKEEIAGHPINWSHYAALLYVGDKKAREFYLENAALNEWSSHELRLRIRNNFYENYLGSVSTGSLGSGNAGELKKINQSLYTYSAKVLKVVDADTLFLNIDVGFCTWMQHKVRLRGINAPEKGTKKGDEAKAFVEGELAGDDPQIVIRSYKTSEKFGRYLVDAWCLKGETDKERILAKGQLLNQVLLDKALAYKVE